MLIPLLYFIENPFFIKKNLFNREKIFKFFRKLQSG